MVVTFYVWGAWLSSGPGEEDKGQLEGDQLIWGTIFLEKDVGRGGQSWGWGVRPNFLQPGPPPQRKGPTPTESSQVTKSASAAEPKRNKIPNWIDFTNSKKVSAWGGLLSALGRGREGPASQERAPGKNRWLVFWCPTTHYKNNDHNVAASFVNCHELWCHVLYQGLSRMTSSVQSSHSVYTVNSIYCRNYLTSMNISIYIFKVSLKSQS